MMVRVKMGVTEQDTKDLEAAKAELESALTALEVTMEVYAREGMNKFVALANHDHRDALYETLCKQKKVAKLFLDKFIIPKEQYSLKDKILSFFYGIFGMQYELHSTLDQGGNHAMHYAFGSEKILQSLTKDFGIPIDVRNQHGETTLMKAAEYGCAEGAIYLINNGANITAQDDKGNNLLHKLASQFKKRDKEGQIRVINKLAELGVLPELLAQRNNKGLTPMDCARNSNKEEAQTELMPMLERLSQGKDRETKVTKQQPQQPESEKSPGSSHPTDHAEKASAQKKAAQDRRMG